MSDFGSQLALFAGVMQDLLVGVCTVTHSVKPMSDNIYHFKAGTPVEVPTAPTTDEVDAAYRKAADVVARELKERNVSGLVTFCNRIKLYGVTEGDDPGATKMLYISFAASLPKN